MCLIKDFRSCIVKYNSQYEIGEFNLKNNILKIDYIDVDLINQLIRDIKIEFLINKFDYIYIDYSNVKINYVSSNPGIRGFQKEFGVFSFVDYLVNSSDINVLVGIDYNSSEISSAVYSTFKLENGEIKKEII